MNAEGRFAGRSVLVTGATGMAASAARRIASEGGTVFCVARTEETLDALALSIEAEGGLCAWHVADVRREEEVIAAFDACEEAVGRFDAVYSVAGISGRRLGDGPLHEATLEGWEAVVRGNATSQFLVAREAVRRMLGPGARRPRRPRVDPADVVDAGDAPRRRALRDPCLRGLEGRDRGAGAVRRRRPTRRTGSG